MANDAPTPPRGRGLALKLALLLASSALALLLAEVVVRLVAKPSPNQVEHHRLLCEHDPLLGWRKIPNARKRFRTAEYDVEERINSKGLRGHEYPYDKPREVYRILVLGDSFTEGYTVEFEDVFTEVLARRLNGAAGGKRLQVINAGTGGYSTDQELLFLRSEGHKYGADLVILMFVHNDVWYNAQPKYPRAAKPFFELRDGALVLTNTPLAEARAEPAREVVPASLGRRIRGAIRMRSALYRFARDRVMNTHWLYRAATRAGLADTPEDASAALAVPDEWEVFRTAPTPAVQAAWTITEALMRALRDDVRAAGGELLVVNVPGSLELYEHRWKAFKAKHGTSDGAWSASEVTERLREVCARNEIELLDLTPTFKTAIQGGRDQREPLFFPIDGHWTANGHRLVGELLAESIGVRHGSTAPEPAFEEGAGRR